jgi:hypothetical protein
MSRRICDKNTCSLLDWPNREAILDTTGLCLSPFLSPFIRLLLTLTSQLKPCGNCSYFIILQHVSFLVLTQPLHHCMKVLPFSRNDLRDLRLKDIQTGLSFCRLTLLGMGLQNYKKHYQNEYQMVM